MTNDRLNVRSPIAAFYKEIAQDIFYYMTDYHIDEDIDLTGYVLTWNLYIPHCCFTPLAAVLLEF